MRRNLRVVAAFLAAFCLALWIVLGANVGWTKTTRSRMARDPVTDIEYPIIEKHFSPGVDLVGGGLIVSAALAGASFAFHFPPKD